MDADNCVNARIFLGERHGSPAAFDSRPDGDEPRDAGLRRSLDHLIKVGGEIRVVEVSMGIDQHGNVLYIVLDSAKIPSVCDRRLPQLSRWGECSSHPEQTSCFF